MEFEFHPAAALAIDQRGTTLLQQVTKLSLASQAQDRFPTQRPIAATITDKNIIGNPSLWTTDTSGQSVFAFIFRDGSVFGFTESSFEEIDQIVDQILKAPWARTSLSRNFVEQCIFQWCRSEFGRTPSTRLSQHIISESRSAVRRFTFWAPIAHLEIEAPFAFGLTQIAPMSATMFDELEAQGITYSPTQKENISALFQQLRKRMQGFAAVVIELDAEPDYAYDKGLSIAEDAIGLLRFFSPASFNISYVCPNALLGSQYLPQFIALLLGDDGSFSSKEGLISKNIAYWRLSKEDIAELEGRGLKEAGKLIVEETSQFGRHVRTSALAFSKGITLPDISDRLVYTLSAIEGLLLKDASEPIQQNLGERMAFMLTKDPTKRRDIVAAVRSAYGMRSQYVHHRISVAERAELQTFMSSARATILRAIRSASKFETRQEFIDAIDRLKFGG